MNGRLLMHDRDAERGSDVRRGDRSDLAAPDRDHAAVRLIHAGQKLDDCGLAAPVGAKQRVNGAGANLKIDAAQNLTAGKDLCETAGLGARSPHPPSQDGAPYFQRRRYFSL